MTPRPNPKRPDKAREVTAHLSYHDVPPTAAVATIVEYNQPQRVARAVAGGLACWGLAIVTVFVPLGHFILVPAFAVAGPVVFLMRLVEGVSLLGARGPCPVCGTDQAYTEKGRLTVPHPVRCGHCRRPLQLTLTTVIDSTERAASDVRATFGAEVPETAPS